MRRLAGELGVDIFWGEGRRREGSVGYVVVVVVALSERRVGK